MQLKKFTIISKNLIIITKGRITIFTDGSLKNGEANIGMYIGPKNLRNRALPCDGIQEINNAELKLS